MNVFRPTSIGELVDIAHSEPDATLIAGGTDVMVGMNAGSLKPRSIIVLTNVADLRGITVEAGVVHIGATVTYRQLERSSKASLLPAVVQAARTVGSPQIRAAGTIGGNLGTASPAGDLLPVLYALGATVTVASVLGVRECGIADFVVGPKRNDLHQGEVITRVSVPIVEGPQEFIKVGVRNAMVIAIASVAAVANPSCERVAIALGSVGPTPLRCGAAEELATQMFPWADGRSVDFDVQGVADLAAEASRPIDDYRASADYRRHAVRVCTARAMRRLIDA